MSLRRIALGALFVALLASLLLVVVAWRSPEPRLPPGALPLGTAPSAPIAVASAWVGP